MRRSGKNFGKGRNHRSPPSLCGSDSDLLPPRSRYPTEWARNAPTPSPPVAHSGLKFLSAPKSVARASRFVSLAEPGLRTGIDGKRGPDACIPPRAREIEMKKLLMMLVPLYALYEFAILAIRLTHWRASRRTGRSSAVEEPRTEEGPEAPPGGGRVGGSGPI